MPSSNLVKARWVGPFDTKVSASQTLSHGDEYEVTADDLKSEHWEAVGSAAKKVEKQAQESTAPAEPGDAS